MPTWKELGDKLKPHPIKPAESSPIPTEFCQHEQYLYYKCRHCGQLWRIYSKIPKCNHESLHPEAI